MHWYNYINTGLLTVIWIFILLNIRIFSKGREFWLLFLAIYSLTEFISLPLEIKGINNLWLYNISKPLQFFSLLLYFTKLLNLKKSYKILILILSVLLCLAFLFITKITQYNSLSDIIFSCIILIFCAVYFYRIIRTDEYIPLSLSEFWICTSLFVFFVTNLCINGALNFLLETHFALARKLFYVLVYNSIIFYLLTIYALLSIRLNYIKQGNGR